MIKLIKENLATAFNIFFGGFAFILISMRSNWEPLNWTWETFWLKMAAWAIGISIAYLIIIPFASWIMAKIGGK